MIRKLCDTQLLISVMASLSSDGVVLNMNQINDEYTALLREHQLEYKWHFKKYLKELIQKNIPDVEFVKPVTREAERVMLSRSVSKAVAFATQNLDDPVIASLLDVSSLLRSEILEHNAWIFAGDLGSFENSPMLHFFLKQLLFGNTNIVGEQREAETKEVVDVYSQVLTQNTRTDRQVKQLIKK